MSLRNTSSHAAGWASPSGSCRQRLVGLAQALEMLLEQPGHGRQQAVLLRTEHLLHHGIHRGEPGHGGRSGRQRSPADARARGRWPPPWPAAWRGSAGGTARSRRVCASFAAPARRLRRWHSPARLRTRVHSRFFGACAAARAGWRIAAGCRSTPRTARSRRSSRAIGSVDPRRPVWIRERRCRSVERASE